MNDLLIKDAGGSVMNKSVLTMRFRVVDRGVQYKMPQVSYTASILHLYTKLTISLEFVSVPLTIEITVNKRRVAI